MDSLQVPTNQRRRRRVDEDDEEQSTRATTPLSQSSTGSKRIRLGHPTDRSEDEENEIENGLTTGFSHSVGEGEFQPGAIVRMRLKDFVTYTNVEYVFGPMLNMIIGPNGTGKSTLVCAICLGLGWGAAHLGRAKEASEFVKHGCREATIEIELAHGPHFRKNPVIRRVIKVEGNKNIYTINGMEANKTKVQKLCQKFNIQIDNLCQFLPQDKVSEFAALTPIELLYSTQRAAAGPQMLEWHDDLIKLRNEQKKLLLESKNDRDLLTNLQNRQELQRADVERIRERAQIKRQIESLKMYRPIATYNSLRAHWLEVKERKRTVNQEYEDLKADLAPALIAVNEKQDYFSRTDDFVEYQRQKFLQADKDAKGIAQRMEEHESSLRNLTSQVEAEKKSGRTYKQQLSSFQQAINKITRQMEKKPEEFDIDSYNERIRTLQREIREITNRAKDIQDGRRPILARLREKESRLSGLEYDLTNLASQSGQREALLKKLSPDTYKANSWLSKNANKFEHEVFGPPLITCSVNETKYADSIESLLQKNDFLAFTTQSLHDFRTLQRALNGELKLHDVTIRNCSSKLSDFKPSISNEELKDLGFDGWAKDFLKGPEPVIAMLCNEQYLFRTPIVLREINDREYARMESHNAINSWVAGKQTYKVNRRKEYGPGATSTQVRQVRPARFWTDQPVDVAVKQELLSAIAQLKGEITSTEQEIEGQRQELANLSGQQKQKTTEKTELEKQKSEKQTALVEFRALPEKLNHQEAKKRDTEKSLEELRARVRELRGKQDQIAIDKAETAITYTDAVEVLRKLHEDLVQAQVRSIEARSDFENLKDRNEGIRGTLKEKENELEQITIQVRDVSARAKELQKEYMRAVQKIRDDPDLDELYPAHESSNITTDQIEAEIDSAKAQLELTHEGSENIVKEFEDRQKAIEKVSSKLSGYQDKLNDHENAIQEIRNQWEPRLDDLVKTISDAFSDSFARIGCAGQVGVDKVEDEPGPNGEPGGSDFGQWSIQIQVKFREHENLSILDSHRQSGGERAVSTIFYLMALQSLSTSPFRVVDEINQGMDPRNERMVHERMVEIACSPRAVGPDGHSISGGSQYFLITPKLLNGLHYAPGIRVQCIASGEHMPPTSEVSDFRRAIQIMDRVTGRAPRAIRSGIVGDTLQGGRINGNGWASSSATSVQS